MQHLHEYCPGPGAATSDSVVGKRTLVQTLRRLALPTLLLCFTLLGLVPEAPVQTAKAQITCDDNICDTVIIVDTIGSCYQLKIYNRHTSRPITEIRIKSGSTGYPIGWICSFDPDTTGIGNTYTGPIVPGSWYRDYSAGDNYTAVYKPTLVTGQIPPCDSGYFRLCICCPYGTNITVPLIFETVHLGGAVCTEDPINFAYLGTPCGPTSWECDEECPELAVSSSTYDPVTKRSKVCVTITNKQHGKLYNFDLSIGCQGIAGIPNKWKVASLPTGWISDGFTASGQTSGTFASSSGLDNCEDMTICFETDNCLIDPCENIKINYVGVGYNVSGICSLSVNATLFNPRPKDQDTSCCAIDKDGNPKLPKIILNPAPTINPITGKSEFCVTVMRWDATAMNTITINHGAGRDLCLTSIPWGWERTGGSGTSDVFTRTTASNEGCRSFTFCYETCDCNNVSPTPQTINVNITGGGAGTSFPVIFPPDQGNCCEGEGPFKEDQATITWSPTAPGCLTYTLLNSHWPCTDVNDFHFTIPLGCVPSSITVPTGFVGSFDPLTQTVNVVPAPESSRIIDCCEEMVVVVCFNNCIGPFPDFEWSWNSTYNGTIVSIETEIYHYAAGPVMQSEVKRLPKAQLGEQNFPNPFGASTLFKTTIPFNASGVGIARIRISDPTGKVILTDEMEVDAAGKRFFYFTGEDLPAGTYYYEIEFPKGKQVVAKRTMILVK